MLIQQIGQLVNRVERKAIRMLLFGQSSQASKILAVQIPPRHLSDVEGVRTYLIKNAGSIQNSATESATTHGKTEALQKFARTMLTAPLEAHSLLLLAVDRFLGDFRVLLSQRRDDQASTQV